MFVIRTLAKGRISAREGDFSSRLHLRFIRASRATRMLAVMKTPDARPAFVRNLHLPEPARALRLARLLIPLCIFVGLTAEPILEWLIPVLSALPLPFSL